MKSGQNIWVKDNTFLAVLPFQKDTDQGLKTQSVKTNERQGPSGYSGKDKD